MREHLGSRGNVVRLWFAWEARPPYSDTLQWACLNQADGGQCWLPLLQIACHYPFSHSLSLPLWLHCNSVIPLDHCSFQRHFPSVHLSAWCAVWVLMVVTKRLTFGYFAIHSPTWLPGSLRFSLIFGLTISLVCLWGSVKCKNMHIKIKFCYCESFFIKAQLYCYRLTKIVKK